MGFELDGGRFGKVGEIGSVTDFPRATGDHDGESRGEDRRPQAAARAGERRRSTRCDG